MTQHAKMFVLLTLVLSTEAATTNLRGTMESTAAKTNDDKSSAQLQTKLTKDQINSIHNAFFGGQYTKDEGLKGGDVDAKIEAINKAFKLVQQIRQESPGSEAALAKIVTKCVRSYAKIIRQSTYDVVSTSGLIDRTKIAKYLNDGFEEAFASDDAMKTSLWN